MVIRRIFWTDLDSYENPHPKNRIKVVVGSSLIHLFLKSDTLGGFIKSAVSTGLSQSDMAVSLVGLAEQVVRVVGCLVTIWTNVLYKVVSTYSKKKAVEIRAISTSRS